MIIGTCGFTGSGSSAVSDYLKEFQTVNVFDKIEFIIAHSPDGLEDLNFQLNEHCSKYTSSEVAIHRFIQNVKSYYIDNVRKKATKKQIRDLTLKYVSAITQVSWIGCGSADLQLVSSDISRFFFRRARAIVTKMPLALKNRWRLYPAHNMYFSSHVDNFDLITKQYVHDLLVILGADFSKPLVLNQPFSGTNPQLAFPYFDDPLAIIVDRDPRDIYISTKMSYILNKGRYCYQIPSQDARQFALYYQKMHEKQMFRIPDSRVLLIRFEDMIYRYEETTAKIIKFCGLQESERCKSFFDPHKSIVNTQTFRRYPDLAKDTAYIEKELSEYLYDFDEFGSIPINGKLWI